jgi:uncharacterized RDD family membrane protein YckC
MEPHSAPPPIPSEIDPYAPPEAAILGAETLPGSLPLASPWRRLLASLFDGVIQGLIVFPLMYFTGIWGKLMAASMAHPGNPFAAALEPSQWVMAGVGFVIQLAVNFAFLSKGQTIGKAITGVRILMISGEYPPVKHLILKRILPVTLVAQIPVIGVIIVLIDALCIFRKERNTLHDDVAGTRVVVA